ncbi:hypothetical protein IWW34DRAFT_776269 [Fusarium oxysporum f. sp. albedinis]|nr:hypothetical protein IWW34DRAFT_776269 [Fusarium oxysporum f. sp. albedinis]
MYLSTVSALTLLLSPLGALGFAPCSSDTIDTDTNKEYSAPVKETNGKYTASVSPGYITLSGTSLHLVNNGGYNRKFCLADVAGNPRGVSCFDVPPKGDCTIPDYHGKPTRLDTYRV